jgi:hypothetical protein
VRPAFLALLLVAAPAIAAEVAPDPATGPVQPGVAVVEVPGLGPAAIQLIAADPRWIQDQLAVIAGAAGADPGPVAALVARALLRLGSLDHIDPGRPLGVWLREGPTDLAMLVPIQRRTRIIDEIGMAADGRAPLVRTGDRDGTVVLTQSTPDGLVEYRALVTEGWLALARTADECRRLIGRASSLTPEGAPLRVTLDPRRLSGGWSRLGLAVEPRWIPARFRLPALPSPLDALPDPGPAAWAALAAQFAAIDIEVAPWGGPGDPEAQGRWRVAVRLRPLPEAPHATWLTNQRLAADRLGPALDTDDAWFLASFYPIWQGQAERLVAGPLAQAAAIAGAAWDGRATDAAGVLAAGADRSGGIGMTDGPQGGLLLIEHGSPADMAVALADILTPVLGAGQNTAVAGATGLVHPGTPNRLTVATDAAVLHAWADDTATLPVLAGRGAAASAVPAPIGQPAVLGRIRLRFDRLLRPVAALQRGASIEMPTAEIVADLTIRDGDLVITADLPATAIASAIGALELGPRPRPAGGPR